MEQGLIRPTQILQTKQIKVGSKNINTEIKTAIVGFGSEFSFKNSAGEAIEYNENYTATQALLANEVNKC